MILSNKEISDFVNNKKLLTNYKAENVQYSSYKLRIGKLFIPEEGIVLESNKNMFPDNFLNKLRVQLAKIMSPQYFDIRATDIFTTAEKPYILKPREIILFQTIESVNMPDNIMATYSALNTIASQGILLINASMIEPRYKGSLSGILVNFSNIDFEIFPQQDIAKICFSRLSGKLDTGNEGITDIDEKEYSKELRIRAKNTYSKTFLSINQLSDEIQNGIKKIVTREIAMAGIILFLLLAYATLQPFVYGLIWNDKNTKVKIIGQEENIYKQDIDKLQNKIDCLKAEIDCLKSKK